MDENEKMIYCPLVGREVDFYGTCFLTAMAMEEMGPAYLVVDGLERSEKNKNICKECHKSMMRQKNRQGTE